MLYTFDKRSLTYKNVTRNWVFITIGIGLCFSFILTLLVLHRMNDIKLMSSETKAIIIKENDKANQFSSDNLKAYILELNIKFPHIVYAQSRLETGNFKSDLFKHNNNLFGMRQATKRPSTNLGEENGFAIYENWKGSVQDFAMYSAAYLNDIKTEAQYLEYLKVNYDKENPNYVSQLQEIIKENNVLRK